MARGSSRRRGSHAATVVAILFVLCTALAGPVSAGMPTTALDGVAAGTGLRPLQVQAADEFAAVIESAGGEHRFTIEVADTPDERAQGLMFRETMAADAGMLFDYGSDQPGVAFWMKNTPLPLDMIFIRADGTITQIAADTTPFSLEPVASREPVRFVLEVNAGIAAKLGIVPGDRLRHPRVPAP